MNEELIQQVDAIHPIEEEKIEVWHYIVYSILGALFLFGLYVGASRTAIVEVELGEGLGRSEIADAFGAELMWSEKEQEEFASIYAQMEWAALNGILDKIVAERFDWGAEEMEVFLSSSTVYFDPEYDLLGSVYETGTYTVDEGMGMPRIADLLISRFEKMHDDDLQAVIDDRIDEEALVNIEEYIERQFDLLPDLVPLPASDLVVRREGGEIVLKFSTTYYNQGEGPLELRGDPETAGQRGEVERDVLQRIYRKDGTYRDVRSGTFLWHQSHLHYHFADFVYYDLKAADADVEIEAFDGIREKSTFCVRDVSRITIESEFKEEKADYLLCKKEVQGISVGWGDTYFFTYPDQLLTITDIPSGTYRLTFTVNPIERFEERSFLNNVASVVLEINKEALSVEVLEETPADYPEIEHIYTKTPRAIK